MFGKNKKSNYFYESFYQLGCLSMNCFETLSVGMKNFKPDMDLLKLKNDVHVSTGGGASLEMIENDGHLPGIDIIG